MELAREFHLSCQNNNLEKLRDCLARGVDVNLVDRNGSGLMMAAYYGHEEILDVLLSHPDIKINQTMNDATALLFASRFGRAGIVSRLVQVPGLDINYKTKDGATAAFWASVRGHSECVRILAETGKVDWNMRNKSGATPLCLALLKGHSETADIIMQQSNIDYNVKSSLKGADTLGHAAVSGGDVKCVETLVAQERFAGWNVPDRDGDTPLMLAIKENRRNVCKLLLKCPRVDLNMRDKNGDNLLNIARKKGNTIIKLIEKSTLVPDTTLLETYREQDVDELVKFVEGEKETKSSSKKSKKKKNKKKSEQEKTEEASEKEKKTLANRTAAEDKLTEKIENLCISLDSHIKTEPVITPEKQRLISYLTKTVKEKEEAIREKESELECPVCLETAGGKIFSCIQQHLVCSQCRPRVVECPQCRQSYPPTPIRHRYAEKMVGELERLREELNQTVLELQNYI